MLKKHNFYDANYDFYYDYLEDNCQAVIKDVQKIWEKKPVNSGNIKTKVLVNSGSVCKIIDKNLFANAVVMIKKGSCWKNRRICKI